MPEGRPGRPWRAPALLVLLAVTTWALYQSAAPWVANFSVFPYALSLVLGPSFVYPLMRRDGASMRLAVAGCCGVPLLWLAKEIWRVTGVFSAGEAAYYALNPLALGLYTALAFQIALWELLLRRRRSGRWQLASGPALTLLAILLLAGTFALAARGSGGREVFYAYIEGYRLLFGDR